MANYFDQFDVVTPEQAGPSPQTRVTVGGPTSSTGGNFFDRFDDPALPDITAPGGIGAAFQQIDEGPQFKPADQRRMADLASAYHEAPVGHGMAVDSRAQQMLKDVENNNPYNNATWQGLTAGFGDEIGAGIRTAFGQGDGYGENLAVERELLRRQREERPLGMAGAEVVGAAIPTFLLPGAGVARTGEAATTAATKAPGFVDRTADAIGAGATYGGIYGFGTGEGGFDSRLEEAGKGAAIGAAGAGVLSPLIEGATVGGKAAVNAARDYMAPFTEAGRERLAGRVLNDSAADPAALRYNLENPEQIVPSVPGSQPTTFQQTGDLGVGLLERQMQTTNPQPFLQREVNQNVARNAALAGIQREGSPEAVVSTLRQHLADIDRSTGDALEAATQTARNQTDALGGAGTTEGYGAAIRGQLDTARNAAKARERALWDAVDPDGTLAADAGGIRATAEAIRRDMPQAAKPMEGDELGIFGTAGNFNGVMPLREITALRSRLSDAMTDELSEHGQSQVYRRLTQLRGAVEHVLDGTVAQRATQEAQAVASGAMREEDTIAANLSRWVSGWREEQAARARSGFGTGPDVAGGTGGFSGSRGSASARGGEFPDAAGAQGISADPRGPGGPAANFTPEAYGRLREASAATRQRAQTYDEGLVGDVLARSGSQGPFHVPATAVAEKFFRRGSMGAEGMRALQAANNSPETAAAIRDYAIKSLRDFAQRDGMLDPARVEAWRRAHADALRAIPEIDRMLASPVQASETMAQLAAARRQAMDNYQAGAVARVIGLDNATDVTKAVGSVFEARNPVQLMRQLAGAVRGNPEAEAGLRKAVADHMTQRLRSMTEAGTSSEKQLKAAAFQRFVADNEPALKEVLRPGEVAMLKEIAADIERSQRSVSGVKLPGRSNTPQDLLAQMKAAGAPQSKFGQLLSMAIQALAGGALGGPMGSAGALVGGKLLSNMRQAGFQKIDDIITEAILNPDLARKLLEKAPPLAPAVAPTVPRAAVPGAVMSVPAFKPEPPQRPLTARERMTQALMSAQRPASNLSPTQQRLVEALAR